MYVRAHEGFEPIELKGLHDFAYKLSEDTKVNGCTQTTIPGLPRVKKKLDEPFGCGEWYNTFGNIQNFATVLYVAAQTRPQILEIVQDEDSPERRIATLIDETVLNGLKTIDIGSGDGPSQISKAFEVLGAESWSADYDGESNGTHVAELDFGEDASIQLLREKTGGDFDFAVESIVGQVPWVTRRLYVADGRVVSGVARKILKPNRYLVSLIFDCKPLVKVT